MLQGILPEHRPWVWMELSGANKRKAEHMASYYEAMVDMGESSSEFTHQIELVRFLQGFMHLECLGAWGSCICTL